MVPSISQAQSIESIINRTITYLQGGLARTVGIFCIIIAGYLCLARQKFPKEYFVMILVGMGIIFGGSSFLQGIYYNAHKVLGSRVDTVLVFQRQILATSFPASFFLLKMS